MHGCGVGSQHDVWIEHCQQRVEVTAARGSEEGVDHFSLASEIGVGNRGRSLYTAACAARELPGSGLRAPHDGSDLVEGHGEGACSTNASRSAGFKVSRTTRSARPTESARSASCPGSIPPSRL